MSTEKQQKKTDPMIPKPWFVSSIRFHKDMLINCCKAQIGLQVMLFSIGYYELVLDFLLKSKTTYDSGETYLIYDNNLKCYLQPKKKKCA